MKAARTRSLATLAKAPLEPRHYVAFANCLRVAARPQELLSRYLSGHGAYPYRCRVRTPLGPHDLTLHSPDDAVTVMEVFCRLDYAVPGDLVVAVDVGANIGVSALYFLTRNPDVRCHVYEPVPQNIERLRRNLEGFGNRYVLHEEAVATATGDVEFGVEPTGRYGGIGLETGSTIQVHARDVNDVLEEVLAAEGRIDVLKIDTEGLEVATVAAIRPRLLPRLPLIYFESGEPVAQMHDELYERSRRGQCERLSLRPA